MLGFALVVREAQRGCFLSLQPGSDPDPMTKPITRYQLAAAVYRREMWIWLHSSTMLV